MKAAKPKASLLERVKKSTNAKIKPPLPKVGLVPMDPVLVVALMAALSKSQPKAPKQLSPETTAAKIHFESMGWSLRSASELLGIARSNLHAALSGRIKGPEILKQIMLLPPRDSI